MTGMPAPRGSRAPGGVNDPRPASHIGPTGPSAPTGHTEARRPRCGVGDRYGGRRCPNPAAHRVILGCVHEHMLVGFACKDHLKAIRGEQLVTCGRCLAGPDPHECPTLGRAATREEQKKAIAHA